MKIIVDRQMNPRQNLKSVRIANVSVVNHQLTQIKKNHNLHSTRQKYRNYLRMDRHFYLGSDYLYTSSSIYHGFPLFIRSLVFGQNELYHEASLVPSIPNLPPNRKNVKDREILTLVGNRTFFPLSTYQTCTQQQVMNGSGQTLQYIGIRISWSR